MLAPPGPPPTNPLAELAKLPPEVQAEVRRQARIACWERGVVSYKFHETQHRIYDALKKSKRRKFFLLCSRRLGKTFTLLCHAFEVALQKPNAQILYLAPLANMAAEIVTSGIRPILEDCPKHVRIEVKPHIKEIHFGNGSIIRLKGVNSEQADNLRGGAQDLVILDECGQMDNLEYVLSSVVLPMTMTTGGKIILATTPAVSPGHDSTAIYQDLADTNDAVKFTLLDAPEGHVSYGTKLEYLLEAKENAADIPDILAGKRLPKGTTALREYFCEFVTDANKAVVPEMREAEPHIVRKHTRPAIFDAYVGADLGFEDKTGLLFAVYDFRAGLISIEDEVLLHRASTNDIATAILDREWALWRDQKPYLRVVDAAGDGGLRLVADMRERHGLEFQRAIKQDSLGGINLLRTMIGNRELVIDPKCKRLVEQLKNATWNNKATDFAHAGANSPDGHYDLLAAGKYLVRSVNRGRNPFPPGYRAPGMQPDGRWRSPRSRFWSGGVGKQLDLLGDTPVGKKIKAKGRR